MGAFASPFFYFGLDYKPSAICSFFRRMFPTCRVSFSGLKSEGRYAVLMDIVPVDNKRYRYAYHRSCWLVAGKADPPAPARLYVHPDSPFTGDQLRKQVVSFEKVKLTNNDMDKHGQVRNSASPRAIGRSCDPRKRSMWVKYRSREQSASLFRRARFVFLRP